MSRRHRARIQSRLRIIVLSVLMTVLIAEVALMQFKPVRLVPAGISASVGLPQIATPAPLGRYSTVVTSDIFAETRSPAAKVLARLSTPSVEEASAIRVIAIVTSGDQRLALVEVPGSDQPQHIHVGDLVGPHRVLAIGADAITLDVNGLRQDFSISHKEASAGSNGPDGLPAPVGAARPSGFPTQAEGEAMNKAFWNTRIIDRSDPATRIITSPHPRG